MIQKNVWEKFIPSMNLPKCRVSIAYDTKDERGIRYAYGHFQFRNGTCDMFWKDGNEQPKSVKAEDIRYWMPVPSLDTQEESVSEDLLDTTQTITYNGEVYTRCYKDKLDEFACKYPMSVPKTSKRYAKYSDVDLTIAVKEGAKWHKQSMAKEIVEGHIVNNDGTFQLICPSLPIVTRNMEEGDRVKLVIIKEDLL